MWNNVNPLNSTLSCSVDLAICYLIISLNEVQQNIQRRDTLGREHLSIVEKLFLPGRVLAKPSYLHVLIIIVNIACRRANIQVVKHHKM